MSFAKDGKISKENFIKIINAINGFLAKLRLTLSK